MPPRSLNEKVTSIKDNNEEIEKLIEEYKPFIASLTSKVSRRYVEYGSDDELSIAMMAFVEAIKAYNPWKFCTKYGDLRLR
jgi:RNA polymerase sigma factor